jgi:L-threonylcarbamoyladenylate synthase
MSSRNFYQALFNFASHLFICYNPLAIVITMNYEYEHLPADPQHFSGRSDQDFSSHTRESLGREHSGQVALRFSFEDPKSLDVTAQLLLQNKVGVIAFNGIYGLFTNADNEAANNRILQIKNRPQDKNLVLVSAPEHLDEHIDFAKAHYSHDQIVALQRHIHALGVILPASEKAPAHIIARRNEHPTVLSIWTEYAPLRQLISSFREQGGRALAGTSANKSGQPTHIDTEEAWQDFYTDVDFLVAADFSHLPDIRKRSTSVLDLTKPAPRLHRLGNVTKEEIQEALLEFRFPDLEEDTDRTIYVKPRT